MRLNNRLVPLVTGKIYNNVMDNLARISGKGNFGRFGYGVLRNKIKKDKILQIYFSEFILGQEVDSERLRVADFSGAFYEMIEQACLDQKENLPIIQPESLQCISNRLRKGNIPQNIKENARRIAEGEENERNPNIIRLAAFFDAVNLNPIEGAYTTTAVELYCIYEEEFRRGRTYH